ncbi:MAG TPA: RNase A-like domain-containing protein [Sphingomonadaceae bacterium]|nr:RNase A-like domain-containing protein [Sphingomonadaceae bacterium]
MLLLVVAIGVTLILPQVAPAVFKGFLGGIGAAMVGSAASQGFGLATGIQDKFSFKQVAMAGISAGVGGSLGGIAGGGLVGGAVGGMAGNAVTQGIAVATGLQKKFDWAGLAVAGVVGGVAGYVGNRLGLKPLAGEGASTSVANHLRHGVTSMAAGIAGAASRSVLTGTSFGDNLIAVLPDVIGSTIGNMIGYGVSRSRVPGSGMVNTEAVEHLVGQAFAQPDTRASAGGAAGIDYFPEATAMLANIQRTLRRDGIVRSLYAESLAAAGGDPAAARADGRRSAETQDGLTFSRSQNERWRQEFVATYGPTKGDYYDYDMKLQNYSRWDGQLAAWDAAANAQISREVGGFLGAGVLGGGTLAAGTIVLGGSLLAGAVTSGLSSGTSGVSLRWALGQENGVQTFAQDSAIGAGFYGAGRAVGYGLGRLGSAGRGEATYSRIVPGGGLAAHEAAGGHLLVKHVGRSESQLMARLAAEPKITGSSSFYDRAGAESAVSNALDANAGNISRWLSGSSGRLRIDHTGGSPIGISVTRGASGAVDVNSTRLILVRNPSMSTGYHIRTGFPTRP